MSDYVLTYSKIKFYPLDPVMEDIHIDDIAHSLSLMTRANGHCKHFYSVAQHSINCYKEAKSRGYSERVLLACLLHGASESYISDITRPVKCNLPEYNLIEDKLQSIIYSRFELNDLSCEEYKQIKEVDDTLLYFELEALMDSLISRDRPYKTMEHDFSQREFAGVKKEFISIFNRITRKQNNYNCIGIDGCKGGWVVVKIADHDFEVSIFKSIADIYSKYDGCDSIIIDMPIGLPECSEDIRPDGAGRVLLPGKTSSIFNTPCRQAVYAGSYTEANEINRRIMGKGLSAQSYAICGKIKEIDEFLNNNPQFKNKLLESHPELCFAMLNSGEPLYENKKTYEGTQKRIELLREYYDQTERLISFANKDPKLSKCMDDVVDALCLAVTGMIGMKEESFKRIPHKPMMDAKGILMQMVYA